MCPPAHRSRFSPSAPRGLASLGYGVWRVERMDGMALHSIARANKRWRVDKPDHAQVEPVADWRPCAGLRCGEGHKLLRTPACSFLLRRHSLSARTRARGDRRPARQRQAEQILELRAPARRSHPRGEPPSGPPAEPFARLASSRQRATAVRKARSSPPSPPPFGLESCALRCALNRLAFSFSPATSSRKSTTLLVKAGFHRHRREGEAGARMAVALARGA